MSSEAQVVEERPRRRDVAVKLCHVGYHLVGGENSSRCTGVAALVILCRFQASSVGRITQLKVVYHERMVISWCSA